MIKNNKQFENVRQLADSIINAISKLDSDKDSLHEKLYSLNKSALESQLKSLKDEMDFYTSIKSGARNRINIDSLEELHKVLISYRIAKGETQKDLADKLGIKVQQIQRYEAQDYQSASWHRILDVIDALGVEIRLRNIVISSPVFNAHNIPNSLILIEKMQSRRTLLKIA